MPLDAALTREATAIAADCFLRGADAVYAAVARRQQCPLVSVDDEHHQRLVGIVTVLTPEQALAQIMA